uniref:Uncharacterized protein n=1 Tax=Asparagus officinalis TaxID=4686 RepID=Q2AA47_ASPOF|nr:hypothetical protein 19.t00006 [Asparagus officinalis]
MVPPTVKSAGELEWGLRESSWAIEVLRILFKSYQFFLAKMSAGDWKGGHSSTRTKCLLSILDLTDKTGRRIGRLLGHPSFSRYQLAIGREVIRIQESIIAISGK